MGIPDRSVWNFLSSQDQTHTVPPKPTSTSHTLPARPEGSRSHVLPLECGADLRHLRVLPPAKHPPNDHTWICWITEPKLSLSYTCTASP